MAHASGPVMENLIPADFTHQKSGVHYRIYEERGRAWLSFDREGEGSSAVQGKRELLYYIGSGQRGLTYLFADDGYIFEAPINWYGDRKLWDMTPAYENATEIPLNLPAHAGCLDWHVSGMRPPIDGTENRYSMPLLNHSGVSCERCHGPGSAHMKGGAIVNPAKLSPGRGDAICMQCHMEGRVSVERPGKHVYDYRPGDSLDDYIRYYVLSGSSQLGAVSQVEALDESTCKKLSGDKMGCTSCHDPHFSPVTRDRAEYFRSKCLMCHGEKFGAKHHAKQRDCTFCHMPAAASKDVAHTQVTDHRIPRVPNASRQPPQDAIRSGETPHLVPFPDSRAADEDTRDLALAYESLANSGVEGARREAERLLRRSFVESPNDVATLSALAYEEQTRGNVAGARSLYQRALAADPDLIDARTNLGVIEAQSGNFRESIELLKGAFERAPGRTVVGMNLARVFCLAGQTADARATVDRVLEFNPDLGDRKKMQQELGSPNTNCGSGR